MKNFHPPLMISADTLFEKGRSLSVCVCGGGGAYVNGDGCDDGRYFGDAASGASRLTVSRRGTHFPVPSPAPAFRAH